MSKKKEQKEITAFNTVIYCDVFDQDVMFHFGETELLRKQIESIFDGKVVDDIIEYIKENQTLGTTFSLPRGTLVFMPKIPKTNDDYGILAHEIFHAVFKLTKGIGIDYSLEGEETYAYLVQYLTKSILEELRNKGIT